MARLARRPPPPPSPPSPPPPSATLTIDFLTIIVILHALAVARALYRALRLARALRWKALTPPSRQSTGGGTALAEIAPLLAKHARALEQMRADDHPRHQSKFGRHDALWRLRFLLSANGDAAKATANARKALAQREAVGLDAIADFVWRRPHYEWPGYAAMRRVCPTVVYAAESGQLVLSVRFGECAFHQPRDVEDAVSVYMYHLAEWMRLYLDCATRRSGRLVKEIRLQAFDGSFSLQRVSLGFSRRFAASQAKIGGVYPQRVAHEVACDPPAWLYAFYTHVIAPLTPIGLREKLLVLSLAEAGDRERLNALLGPSRVPTHLGGPLDLGSVKDLRERRLEDVFS